MEAEPSATETEPRKRQISLGMIFAAVAYFAVALLGARPLDTLQTIISSFLLAPLGSIGITLIVTKGAAVRETALGFVIGFAGCLLYALRNKDGDDIALVAMILTAYATWMGSVVGAAARGHRFSAWVAFASMLMFTILIVTPQ